jgi:hypothetical protein
VRLKKRELVRWKLEMVFTEFIKEEERAVGVAAHRYPFGVRWS